VPELELSKEESQKLADAAASVAVYYDIEASKKTMAWVNLSFVMGGIYGSRFITIRHNRKVEREAKNNPVTVMPPLNGGLQ
jgi:hypothetical protein